MLLLLVGYAVHRLSETWWWRAGEQLPVMPVHLEWQGDTLSGTFKLPVQLGNGTTLYVDAEYYASVNSSGYVRFTAPQVFRNIISDIDDIDVSSAGGVVADAYAYYINNAGSVSVSSVSGTAKHIRVYQAKGSNAYAVYSLHVESGGINIVRYRLANAVVDNKDNKCLFAGIGVVFEYSDGTRVGIDIVAEHGSEHPEMYYVSANGNVHTLEPIATLDTLEATLRPSDYHNATCTAAYLTFYAGIGVTYYGAYAEADVLEFGTAADGTVAVGGVLHNVALDGSTYNITVTPPDAASLTISNNRVLVVAGRDDATLYWNGQEIANNTELTPAQLWQDNRIYVVSNDPSYPYIVRYDIPVVKADIASVDTSTLSVAGGSITLDIQPAEAKNTTLPAGQQLQVALDKLPPGITIVDVDAALPNNGVVWYAPDISLNVSGRAVIDYIPRQYWGNRIITGYLKITNYGNVSISNLQLSYEVRSLDGNVVDSYTYTLDEVVDPGLSKSILMDQFGIPLPPPGKYKLVLKLQYDPAGTVYTLQELEAPLDVGYKLTVATTVDADVEVLNSTGGLEAQARLEAGDATEFVLPPGTYTIRAVSGNYQVEKTVQLAGDSSIVLDFSNAEPVPPKPSDTITPPLESENRSPAAALLVLLLLLLAVVLLRGGSRGL